MQHECHLSNWLRNLSTVSALLFSYMPDAVQCRVPVLQLSIIQTLSHHQLFRTLPHSVTGLHYTLARRMFRWEGGSSISAAQRPGLQG